MRLVDNWRKVIKHAWSMRLMLLAGALSGAEIALPILDEFLPIPRGVFAAGSGLVTMFALVARLTAQQSLRPREPLKDDELWQD